MSEFVRIMPQEMKDNPFSLIGDDWMLITAGDATECNTMTASWGSVGILWNKPIAIAYVRPTRHTYSFMESSERFTLSVLSEEYRSALRLCGTLSGRDTDKFSKAGLTPFEAEGVPAVKEARLILVCRKLYVQDILPQNFVDKELLSHYKANDYHRQYIGEIEAIFKKA